MSHTDPTHPSAPADGAPLLRVAGLRKSFGENEVLRRSTSRCSAGRSSR